MKNLFIGGSSEIAKNIAKKLYFTDCVSRKNSNIYNKCFKIKNYKIQEIKKTIKSITKTYDNILIFNGEYQYSSLNSFSVKEFDKSLYINFKVPIIFATELINNENLKKNGSVYFFSSVAAHTSEKGNAYYSIAKNALNFASKIFSNEQKERNYRINVISLGLIDNIMGKSTLAFKINNNVKFLKKKSYIDKIKECLKNKKVNQKIILIK